MRSRSCRRCGAKVDRTARECPACGAPRPVHRTLRFDRNVLAFGCLVAILVVAALLFLFWAGGGS